MVTQWRGRGVGRALLGEITSRAKSAGIGAISLSVERANFAHHLYLSEGYKIVKSSQRPTPCSRISIPTDRTKTLSPPPVTGDVT